jgi:hypothetical protein
MAAADDPTVFSKTAAKLTVIPSQVCNLIIEATVLLVNCSAYADAYDDTVAAPH